MDTVDAVIIGGGVVGLACARQLSISGLSVIILESETNYGMGQSSRNSEVIHGGLYYQPGSMKAKLCIKGRNLLYEYCNERNIKHLQIGKWIIANGKEQIDKLDEIFENAIINGCSEVHWLEIDKALKEEPNLIAEKVLVSPRTGIIDSHEYMLNLLADVEKNGGIFVPNSKVTHGESVSDGIILNVSGKEESKIKSKYVVNSAGMQSVELAKKLSSKNIPNHPKNGLCKGNYFSYSGKVPFSRLIYPVPEPGGLGIHLTLDLNGQARFGPDVEWVDKLNYNVDPNRKESFVKEIKKYWKDIDENKLSPDYSGFRSKVEPFDNEYDFHISYSYENGVNGLVNLFGIESPGLTASLAIAESVSDNLLNYGK